MASPKCLSSQEDNKMTRILFTIALVAGTHGLLGHAFAASTAVSASSGSKTTTVVIQHSLPRGPEKQVPPPSKPEGLTANTDKPYLTSLSWNAASAAPGHSIARRSRRRTCV